ncbi:hypothetical protein ACCC92_09605 [Mucilaginibacter sp. Mucisp84]|uniref:hypothetical protein n=1 Tax=Mucilaginibacter sp. Mucisp84 TaxID=3243058 RepID=UPI0039A54FBF
MEKKSDIHVVSTILFLILGYISNIHNVYAFSAKSANGTLCDTTLKKNGEVFTYSTIVKNSKNRSYSLEIKTIYIYDKDYLENLFVADSNMIVIRQELIFKHHNTIVATKNHSVRKNIVIKNGKKTKLLENVIVEVGIEYGKKGAFYAIEGSGLCNSCSVYSAFFSMTGHELYKEYSSRDNTNILRKGNFNNIMNTYGVRKSKWLHRFTTTWVFPPKRSGENIN